MSVEEAAITRLGGQIAVLRASAYGGELEIRMHPLDVAWLQRHYGEKHPSIAKKMSLHGLPLVADCAVRRDQPGVYYR